MSDHSKLLFSLAGKAAQWPHRALRSGCQNRANAHDENVLRVQVKSDREDLRGLARDLDDIDKGLANKVRADNDVLAFIEDNSARALREIREAYRREYTDGDVPHKCPYEREGGKRSCFGCPVPNEAFKRMELQRGDV